MRVSFHVDFRKDMEGALDIALGIIPKKLHGHLKIQKREKNRLLENLQKNKFNYDKVRIPSKIIDDYRSIFLSKEKLLMKTKNKIEKKWREIESTFSVKFSKKIGRFNQNLHCYIVYSYGSIGGTHAVKPEFLIGYKVADVDTIIHEIIHLHLAKSNILKNSPSLHEIVARIAEYKLSSKNHSVKNPHFLCGMTPKDLRIFKSLQKKMDIETSSLRDIVRELTGL